MRKTKYTRKKKKSKLLLYLLILAIPLAYYLIFHMNNDEFTSRDASEYLLGSWERTDGTYTIQINAVKDEGILDASYFNPNPINVGRAGWKVQEKVLKIYIQMDDVNYRGSYYDLNYDKDKNILRGTYYQATMKQTYQVNFQKKE